MTSRMSVRPSISSSRAPTIAIRFSAADVEPDPRLAARHPGHVAKAAGRESQQRGVFLGSVAGHAHQRRRGEVRHVADDGDELVVPLRCQRHHVGAERRDDAVDPGEDGVVAVLERREHPHRAVEQVGLGTVEPVEFAARPSGCPPMNRRRSFDRQIGAFTLPTSVTDAACLGQRPLHLVGDGQHRDGDEGDLGIGIKPDGIDDAAFECGCHGALAGRVVTADVPAGCLQRRARPSHRSVRDR